MTTLRGDRTPLWEPSEAMRQQANMTKYMHWLQEKRGLHFETRNALWQWSVDYLGLFFCYCLKAIYNGVA